MCRHCAARLATKLDVRDTGGYIGSLPAEPAAAESSRAGGALSQWGQREEGPGRACTGAATGKTAGGLRAVER